MYFSEQTLKWKESADFFMVFYWRGGNEIYAKVQQPASYLWRRRDHQSAVTTIQSGMIIIAFFFIRIEWILGLFLDSWG